LEVALIEHRDKPSANQRWERNVAEDFLGKIIGEVELN
jgi:hypothetical protein